MLLFHSAERAPLLIAYVTSDGTM